MEAEGQGEGDDAAEKVLEQSVEAHGRVPCVDTAMSGLKLVCDGVFRTVRMRRRWGTCSWPGRCWKWLKSSTRGNRLRF